MPSSVTIGTDAAAANIDRAKPSQTLPALTLAALGVVYGDIGTSPLYTLKTCLTALKATDAAGIAATVDGVLSLIFWSLTLVVTIKYVVFIMSADNKGEGGILALTALAGRAVAGRARAAWWIAAAGIAGSALFYGDGLITPAISVLSAVEGLKVATPVFEEYVIPVTLALLLGLFLMQKHGTARVGGIFGPVMILWFAVLAVSGIAGILEQPAILFALNPWYGLALILHDPLVGFVLLGAVVLAVTGGEALYADMGHFGRRPIRLAWFGLVLPALVLNYFGQGAHLLADPKAIDNPFYRLVPGWGIYPLVVLASAATIIASQAVISGAFSLTRQAIQLGYLPRMRIEHTSAEEIGQIYLPAINHGLLLGVFILVLGFRSSDAIAAAYGIAVTGTMAITTILAYIYVRNVRHWSLAKALPLFGLFLAIDLAFFGSNLLKVVEGGWVPLVIAAGIFALMTTWRTGRRILLEHMLRSTMPLDLFIRQIGGKPRVPGTAIYMTSRLDVVPVSLLHNLKHNKVLHERIVLMRIATLDVPRVSEDQRLQVEHHPGDFHTVEAQYGFMEQPNIPVTLRECRKANLRFSLMETSFFLGREKIVPAKSSYLSRARRALFIALQNNAVPATDFFRIPVNRVVELGSQIEI